MGDGGWFNTGRDCRDDYAINSFVPIRNGLLAMAAST